MKIIGTVETFDVPVGVCARRVFAGGGAVRFETPVQAECLLEVYVNDEPAMRLTCSASMLAELAVGRLFTEGLIASADEVEALSVCEHSMRADVYLADRARALAPAKAEAVPTCCTGNRTLVDWAGAAGLAPLAPVPWDEAAVFSLARVFAEDRTSHAKTRGSHSAMLSTLDGEVLVTGEDIGRHNAFDKCIGWALINGVDLGACMLFTSGRVPTDMATKAVRARIPILISKAVATDRTAELARQYGLTLICSAQPASFDVLNDPRPAAQPVRKTG